MLFNSIEFIIFFPIVTIIYFLFPKKYRYLWLLSVSYYFYMSWNTKYALLLLASTLITYAASVGIAWCDSTDRKLLLGGGKRSVKKCFVAGSIICNLLILFFFKYADFAIDSINALLSFYFLTGITKKFDVILPVGISFYIFQALGYTIDVYRGEVKAEKNFLRYALFVSFFPQLVAGPIERSGSLLRQIRQVHHFDAEEFLRGFWLMLFGFFEKIVIADRAAIYVDKVFADYTAVGGIQVLFAILGFTLQIYCDFSGYSHIAIGTAEILGIRLTDNFRQPYFAVSIRDFWQRWHISLSSWFRDYLYIPLGGSRCARARKYFNIMVTFIASGLWHGASWHFVIWGWIHGCYQIFGELLRPVRKKLLSVFHIDTSAASHRMLQCLVTFCLVSLAWLFFRAETVEKAVLMLEYIHDDWRYVSGADVGLNTANIVLLMISAAGLFVLSCFHENNIHLSDKLMKQNAWFKVLVTFAATFLILLFGIWGGSYDASSFIYFQF